jgi:hypothetical protein
MFSASRRLLPPKKKTGCARPLQKTRQFISEFVERAAGDERNRRFFGFFKLFVNDAGALFEI